MNLNIPQLYFLILKRRALAIFSLMERLLARYCQLRFFTPKYLTHLEVRRMQSFTINFFKAPSNFFGFNLNITISVFLTLNKILFAFNQETRCFKSALTSFMQSYSDIIDQCHQQCDEHFILLRLFIYNKSRRGLRTDPSGMPQFIIAGAIYICIYSTVYSSIYGYKYTDFNQTYHGIIQKKYGHIGFLQSKKGMCQRHVKHQLGVWEGGCCEPPSGSRAKPPKNFQFFCEK